MSIFSKLFGGGSKSGPEPVEHGDYRIFVEPQTQPGGHRIGARIEKTFGEEVKTHMMIRADLCQSMDEAKEISLLKAKKLIEEQGDSIFG